MSETKVTHRVAAIVLALLFLATSLGFSGLVIWEMQKENKRNKQSADLTNSVNNNSATNSADNSAGKDKEGMLEGTKLEGFSPVDKVDEIQITDMQEGAGNEVKIGDSITAHYTGALAATGVIFQSSHDSGQPFTADLLEGQLIQGWIEGIPGMKAGGKRRIVIPAAKAYGEQGQNGIPANSDLVFDVELQAIN